MSDSAPRNRAWWDRQSDEYQQRHGEFIGKADPRWGMWQIPESELRILGDVSGKDVLELGCGAAQWSIALARQGARVVGLDNSERQLEHARRLMAEAGVDFPLVHSAAEHVPLPDASFDVVFCDHGALTFGDPYRVVPEAARLLRPEGLLAFAHIAPLFTVCWNVEADSIGTELRAPYFGMYAWQEGEDEAVDYNLPHGEWIRLLHDNGLRVDALVEVQPPESAASTYRTEAETEWARRWPMEEIWRARKTVETAAARLT